MRTVRMILTVSPDQVDDIAQAAQRSGAAVQSKTIFGTIAVDAPEAVISELHKIQGVKAVEHDRGAQIAPRKG